MAKKNFKGIDAFFGENTDKKSIHREQNGENSHENIDECKDPSNEKGDKRATFIIDVELIKKIKAVAFWERKTSKIVLKECLEDFFSKKGELYMEEALKRYRESIIN